MSDARVLRAFATELVAAGVTDAIVCPGSRSTPLALALRTATGLRVRVMLDERAAGFFALALARTSGLPRSGNFSAEWVGLPGKISLPWNRAHNAATE